MLFVSLNCDVRCIKYTFLWALFLFVSVVLNVAVYEFLPCVAAEAALVKPV